jgi:hypothetical protein
MVPVIRKTAHSALCRSGTPVADDIAMEVHAMVHLATPSPVSHDLGALIRAEYLEMPGLCLTIAQAARLWNVGRDECVKTLDALANAGFLYRSKDQYLRMGSGRWFL